MPFERFVTPPELSIVLGIENMSSAFYLTFMAIVIIVGTLLMIGRSSRGLRKMVLNIVAIEMTRRCPCSMKLKYHQCSKKAT